MAKRSRVWRAKTSNATMRDKHAPEREDYALAHKSHAPAHGSPMKAQCWAVGSGTTGKGGGEARLWMELA